PPSDVGDDVREAGLAVDRVIRDRAPAVGVLHRVVAQLQEIAGLVTVIGGQVAQEAAEAVQRLAAPAEHAGGQHDLLPPARGDAPTGLPVVDPVGALLGARADSFVHARSCSVCCARRAAGL